MRDLLKLICMAVVLLTFTQCGKDSEPEPETVQETWQLTYNDYHYLMNTDHDEYQNLTRNVTVVRDGDELTFKGLFPEYPDASIKGFIKDYKICVPDAQIIEINGNDTVYFHCGYVDFNYYWSYTNGSSTDVDFKPGEADQGVFIIQDDGCKMIAPYVKYSDRKCAFWISSGKDGHISFNSYSKKDDNGNYLPATGTGFPDIPNMYKMELTKISDSDK